MQCTKVVSSVGSGIPTTGGEAPLESQPSEKFCVEKDVPLCSSVMWTMLQNYYKKVSIDAWAHNYIPSFVTSNSRLARSYARVILNYLKDWYNSPSGRDTSTPVYILEIGGGHGRFTHLVTVALLRYKSLFKSLGLPERPFLYVYTDVAEANVAFCKKHPSMQNTIKEGWLDFAIFDGNSKNLQIQLQVSGSYFVSGTPIVVIANYVLDSLLTDAWRIVQEGEKMALKRALVSVYSPKAEPDPTAADIMSRMSIQWNWKDVALDFDNDCEYVEEYKNTPSDYLTDIRILNVLKAYKKMNRNLSFVLPVGAFSLFDTLLTLSGNKIFCLVGDKGYPNCDEFYSHKDPHISIHGTISFMVNLHAIRLYFESIGGFSMATPWRDSFQLTSLWACGDSKDFGSSQAAFLDDLDDMAPDSLIHWQRAAIDLMGTPYSMSMKQLVSLLRYSGHDCDIFWNFRTQFAQQCVAPFTNSRAEIDLLNDIELVFANWYKLRDNEDIPDVCAHICMRLGRCDKALFYFKHSLQQCPESIHAATFVNMASCYKALGDIQSGLECCEKALLLSPDFPQALEIMKTLQICSNPYTIALIGCGSWTRFEVMGLLKRDKRYNIIAVFSFCTKDAEALKNDYLLDNSIVYGGSSGFSDLLARPDIQCCIVDIHAQLMYLLLPKLWQSGKHTLTRNPLAFKIGVTTELLETYKKYSSSLAWHCFENYRFEDAFVQANNLLSSLGYCMSFSVQYVTDSGFRSQYTTAPYEVKDQASIEIVHCLNAIKVITGKRLAALSARFISSSNQPQADGIVTPDKNKLDQIRLYENNSMTRRDCIVSWARFSNHYDDNSNLKGIVGSLFITHTGGDNSLKLSIFCSKGTMELVLSSSVWLIKVSTDTIQKTCKEIACHSVGHQNSYDAWVNEIASKGSHPSTKLVSRNSIGVSEDSIGSTVQEALSDTAVIEGVLFSMEKNGTPVLFECEVPTN